MPLMELQYSKILISFDGVLKNPDPFILRMIAKNYKQKFDEYLNLDFLASMDDTSLQAYVFARNEQNLFKWLAKKEFDYDKNYTYFKNKYKNMYFSTLPLPIIDNIHNFLKAYFIDKILFYSKTYDKRIAFDLRRLFGTTSKVAYTVGNLNAVITEFEPQLVFYPYLNDILPLAKKDRDIIFAIPNYGFNMTEEGLLKSLTDEDNNVGYYPILRNEKNVFFG